jgi:hypothetical protein
MALTSLNDISLVFTSLSMLTILNKWIFNTRTDDHITNDFLVLIKVKPCSKTVIVSNQTIFKIKCKEIALLYLDVNGKVIKLWLLNVLYLLDFSANLISYK